MKECIYCHKILSLDNFHIAKDHKDGHDSRCKKCVKEYRFKNRERIKKQRAQFYRDNKERINQTNREYYGKNKAEMNAKMRKWRKDNLEKAKAYNIKHYHSHRQERIEYSINWIKENPDKYKEYVRKHHQNHLPEHAERQRRRYAQKINNGCEKTDYREIYERYNYTCQICGKENLSGFDLTIDHILPIAKGGPHVAENLQVACRSCNCRKGAKI
jgi:hypothetical protein